MTKNLLTVVRGKVGVGSYEDPAQQARKATRNGKTGRLRRWPVPRRPFSSVMPDLIRHPACDVHCANDSLL
ncbi:hypothetical protein J2Y48_003862 [Mycoplana sp. BE70]|uniref:hypothetical protein n=1 Tax=Mycoplana sp. BE70 TaxID=2817775 RepID=UPI0028579121|nr:hypothetical protein [Mycoplana sp. BE70]MDR6758562.1 hypothetical protein [Mycoplana sp. BE70]